MAACASLLWSDRPPWRWEFGPALEFVHPRGQRKEGLAPLTLTADEGTNTLIAIGEPRLLAQVETLLATLDVRQPQVMLEVMLVSLTQAQTLDLGIELERVLTHADDTKIRLASLFGLSTSGAAGRSVGDAAGFIGTVLNPGEFAVVVRALQGVNSGRSLSAPQVLVNNNQQATISALLQQPFVSTNASTTVATTSFGGTQDAGTQLTIKPQIAAGDHLILDYSVTLSSFVGALGNAALLPRAAEHGQEHADHPRRVHRGGRRAATGVAVQEHLASSPPGGRTHPGGTLQEPKQQQFNQQVLRLHPRGCAAEQLVRGPEILERPGGRKDGRGRRVPRGGAAGDQVTGAGAVGSG